MKKLLIYVALLFISVASYSQAVTNTVVLDGSGSTDADGTVVGYSWTKVSGPAGGDVMQNATSVKNTVVYTLPGTYIYSLVVTDNQGAKSTNNSTVEIDVLAANQAPKANAGANQTIQLPASTSFNYDKKTNLVMLYLTPMKATEDYVSSIIGTNDRINLEY